MLPLLDPPLAQKKMDTKEVLGRHRTSYRNYIGHTYTRAKENESKEGNVDGLGVSGRDEGRRKRGG